MPVPVAERTKRESFILKEKTMSDELKPCPFCGCEAEFVEDNLSEAGLVDCKQCGVTTNIGNWNTRVGQPALQWMKEPPTEKDIDRWFVCWASCLSMKSAFIGRYDGECLKGENLALLKAKGYRFIGPLPE